MPGRGLAVRVTRAVLAAAILSAGTAACARPGGYRLPPVPPEATRAGLTQSDYLLRRSLSSGTYDSAAALVAPNGALAPDDELLASLYRGSTLYYAGRYGIAGATLDQAAILADDRFTKSISKNLLALVTNDGALPYEPPQTERLMMNYYGMLDYLRRDDPMGAAVEARRISALLESYDTRKDSVDIPTRALMNYLAGATFEAAGEKTDADVSYRVARALVGDALPFPLTGDAKRKAIAAASKMAADRAAGAVDTLHTPAGAKPKAAKSRPAVVPTVPTGEVIVIVEHGFVAHRVPRMLLVPVSESEFEKFGGTPEETVEAVAAIGLRTTAFLALQPDHFMWRDTDDDDEFTVRDSTTSLAYLMPIAWASLRRPYHPPWRGTLLVDANPTQSFGVTADLCNAVANDFRRQRGPALARGIARAGIKLALAKTAEKEAEEKKGAFAGQMAKITMNAINAFTERADLRQWRLLPGELSIVRMTLPAGVHDLAIDYVAAPGAPTRRLVIGPTKIVAGKLAFATTRVWDDGVTQLQPLAVSH